jgi:DivIVA domain-containing protein
MNESDRRQRVISSTPRLSPDEIANRTFAKGVRGFAETEVRAFLKRVSEEIVAARAHEQELEGAIDALEEEVRKPRPLSEQELLDALGEETARLLRSAREASDDIRGKAEERAVKLVEEATADADRTRSEAADLLVQRTAEAEARSGELIAEAEARSSATLETARTEAEAIVEQARTHGREMLEEAKAARERVLADLVRRRALLNAQIEALRNGRDHLLDAYRTVKRTFLDATEALVQVETRAAVERAAPNAQPIDLEAEVAAEIDRLDGVTSTPVDALLTQGDDGVVLETVSVIAVAGVDETDSEVTSALDDVDSLFARLRAGQGDGEPDSGEEAAGASPGETGASGPTAPADTADDGPRTSVEDWRETRNKVVDPLVTPLLKRAKRRAQDDQNSLLDSVRRHKGRPTSQQVLSDDATAREAWGMLLREAVDRAYGAGRVAAGADDVPASEDLIADAADAVVAPLRERLAVAIDAADEHDTGGLVERIGARYREWKNQTLERTLGEVLAFSWTRGVYDAVPDEAVLWWVPAEDGHCPDCDDNALEPTVKGKQFPTGQPFPPAHPGCKCLLAPAGVLEGR